MPKVNTQRITIASIQPPFSETKSVEDNGRMIEAGFKLLIEALKKDVAFACLPEFFNCFGIATAELGAAGENWQSILERTRGLAREYSSHIVLPMVVPVDGAHRNRAYVIDGTGEIAGFYDKTHLTVAERDDLGMVAGDEIKAFDTEHGRIAVVICYDVYFPELLVAVRAQRPDMVFFPSLQRSDHELANAALLQTRAMDTQAYIVRSSFGCPLDVPWSKDMMFGQSAIVHPDGTILANAGHYEGIALAQVTMPFAWRRNRCGGYGPMTVRDFLDQDRRGELYRG